MTLIESHVPGTEAGRTERSTAIREIAVFLTTVAVLTTVSTVVGVREGVDVDAIEDATPLGAAAMYTQAFFPFLAALLTQLVVHRRLRGAGWGFRRSAWRRLAGAWALSVACVMAPTLVLWATGLVEYDGDGAATAVPLGLTVLVLPYLVLALGEGIGWRGLLVTRLAAVAGPRTVVLVAGLAWAGFHVPLMLWLGGTPAGVPVAYTVAVFTVGITAFGAVLASMHLRWGIWPGVVAHATLNAAMYAVVDPLSVATDASGWLVSETGIAQVVLMVVVAALWLRRYPVVTRA
jgi:membrane protease YdiL (CAAX protease family)